jgi:hypothetical protein
MGAKGPYKVKVTIGDAVIEVEGEEKGVVAIVQALSNVMRSDVKSASPVSPIPSVSPSQRLGQIDIRTFFQEKKPSSDIEAAAAVAYYYRYLAPADQRKDAIDPPTLQEAFRLARRPLPTKTAYTLANARGAGYLDSTSETGFYRLNPVGFNLVEHTLGKGEAEVGKKNLRRKRSVPEKKRRKARKS